MRCGVVLLVAVLSLGTAAAESLSETANDQIQENFDINQFLGTWFALATGCNCSWFSQYKEVMTINKVVLSTSEESNTFIGTFQYDRNGTCIHHVGHYAMKDTAGHFVFNSTGAYAEAADIRVIKINYQEYAFLLINTSKGVDHSKSVTLYGRTRHLTKETTEEFKEFALRQGIPEDMILFLPEKGACVPWDPIPESSVKDRKRRALDKMRKGLSLETS
ncbi:protein AMBP-like [Chiloscyllium plagiosum]|uniref:protein AMBP-like n=1 Tax=Chiloscyllium plagiosum TaxID=36176 RepID=UPI001CB8370E|nr:protein AMBP-like [Chiloscyllium plagiosum]